MSPPNNPPSVSPASLDQAAGSWFHVGRSTWPDNSRVITVDGRSPFPERFPTRFPTWFPPRFPTRFPNAPTGKIFSDAIGTLGAVRAVVVAAAREGTLAARA